MTFLLVDYYYKFVADFVVDGLSFVVVDVVVDDVDDVVGLAFW